MKWVSELEEGSSQKQCGRTSSRECKSDKHMLEYKQHAYYNTLAQLDYRNELYGLLMTCSVFLTLYSNAIYKVDMFAFATLFA